VTALPYYLPQVAGEDLCQHCHTFPRRTLGREHDDQACECGRYTETVLTRYADGTPCATAIEHGDMWGPLLGKITVCHPVWNLRSVTDKR
jgi:hypothetical protein